MKRLPIFNPIKSVEDLNRIFPTISLEQEYKPWRDLILEAIKNKLELALEDHFKTGGSQNDFAGITTEKVEEIIENTLATIEKEKVTNIRHTYNSRGKVKLQLGEYESAFLDFSEANKFDNSGGYKINMGIAKYHLKEYQPAINFFDEARKDFAVQIGGELASELYYYSGLSKYKLGQHLDAIADFEKALLEQNRVFGTPSPLDEIRIHKIKKIKKFILDSLLSEEERILRWYEGTILELHGHLCVCGDRAEKVKYKLQHNCPDIHETPESHYCALCLTCYESMPNGFGKFKNISPIPTKGRVATKESVAYDHYLKTDSWKIKRKMVFKRDESLCICGAPAKQVHHKTYKRLRLILSSAEEPVFIGEERLSDLVAVCEPCHDKIHGRETLPNRK